jgi:hypothetical protein
MDKNGRILITCPTATHQEFLSNNYPQRLQPIDIIIIREDLEDFAHAINGSLHFYKEMSIWRKNDYFHCILERGNLSHDPLESKISLTPKWKRKQMVRRNSEKLLLNKVPSKLSILKVFLKELF